MAEISRGVWQIIKIIMASFSLNTCTQPDTPLINVFVDHVVLNK